MPTDPVTSAPLCKAADRNPVAPRFTVPAGACDCHAHVFAAPSGLVEGRTYTPANADFDDYRKLLDVLSLSRGVIVQPSVYGTDNRTTLKAVEQGGSQFRAVVVVDDSVTAAELHEMHGRGARGARVNGLFNSDAQLENLEKLTRTLAEVGWHIQMLVDVSAFDSLDRFVRSCPVPVVFDHFGHQPVNRGLSNPGFRTLLRLVEDEQCWVKLSGAYRITSQIKSPFTDVNPFAQALVRANPERLVWATDWPHPHIPTDMPNDGYLLDQLAEWVPDEEMRNKILVDNPQELYGFEPLEPEG